MTKKRYGPVDAHVAQRLRERREALGITLQQLSEFLPATWQQLQKYELKKNRIGAGMLLRLSLLLDVPVSYFFKGAPSPFSEEEEALVQSFRERIKTIAAGISERAAKL